MEATPRSAPRALELLDNYERSQPGESKIDRHTTLKQVI